MSFTVSEEIIAKAKEYLRKGNLSDDEIDLLGEIGYFHAPASKAHHLNWPGGLIVHSINVTDKMLSFPSLAERKDWNPYRVGMLHDLVKCLCYELFPESNDDHQNVPPRYRYVQPPYPGHGVASVMMAIELGIQLYPSDMAAITWHMGAFGLSDDDLRAYNEAVKRFPDEIIYTHAADHIASMIESRCLTA